MIEESKVLKEVKWLEKQVESTRYITKSGMLRLVQEFKERLNSEPEEFEIPVFLRRD